MRVKEITIDATLCILKKDDRAWCAYHVWENGYTWFHNEAFMLAYLLQVSVDAFRHYCRLRGLKQHLEVYEACTRGLVGYEDAARKIRVMSC